MRRPASRLIALAAVGALAVSVGCSDDSGRSSVTEAEAALADGALSGVVTEWSVELETDTIPAGEITFEVANEGSIGHEFLVLRTDVPNGSIPLEGDAFSEEENSLSVVDEIPEFPAGTTEELTVELEPGAYQIVCNLPGHYAAGMHTSLAVTGS